jgi:hypothetical protein
MLVLKKPSARADLTMGGPDFAQIRKDHIESEVSLDSMAGRATPVSLISRPSLTGFGEPTTAVCDLSPA